MEGKISLTQLARTSGRGKGTILTMVADGELRGVRDQDGRRTLWIDRQSAADAGLLTEPVARTATPTTVDDALRAVVRAELEPVFSALNRTHGDVGGPEIMEAMGADRANVDLYRQRVATTEPASPQGPGRHGRTAPGESRPKCRRPR